MFCPELALALALDSRNIKQASVFFSRRGERRSADERRVRRGPAVRYRGGGSARRNGRPEVARAQQEAADSVRHTYLLCYALLLDYSRRAGKALVY